jgi:hypothetical protein
MVHGFPSPTFVILVREDLRNACPSNPDKTMISTAITYPGDLESMSLVIIGKLKVKPINDPGHQDASQLSQLSEATI